MSIYIEKCISSCLNCFNMNNFQYRYGFDDDYSYNYLANSEIQNYNPSFDHISNEFIKKSTLITIQEAPKPNNSMALINQFNPTNLTKSINPLSPTSRTSPKIRTSPLNKITKPIFFSLETNIINDYTNNNIQKNYSLNNDYIIDLAMLKNSEEDNEDFELVEKNE